jgi:hypothetical protein
MLMPTLELISKNFIPCIATTNMYCLHTLLSPSSKINKKKLHVFVHRFQTTGTYFCSLVRVVEFADRFLVLVSLPYTKYISISLSTNLIKIHFWICSDNSWEPFYTNKFCQSIENDTVPCTLVFCYI